MLKSMQTKKSSPNTMYIWGLVALLVISGIVVLISALGGNNNAEEEVNAVYTNAAATVAAQQLTLQASVPSATPTLSVTQTPTATIAPISSPTLFATQAGTGGSTTGGSTGGSTAVGCNNSAYVADVSVPDNTVMTPGQTFTKTWKLQNTGSCPWTPAFKVTFVSGNAMGGAQTALTTTVQPGQSADISVAMTAPSAAGDATGYWILTNESGQNFGSSFYVLIKVGGASTTGTVVATATTASSAPAAPTDLDITLTCNLGGTGGTQYEYVGTLTWTDNSTNETGFNLFVNGSKIASVAANITSYVLPAGIYYDPNNPVFAVEAENSGVKSAQNTASELCP